MSLVAEVESRLPEPVSGRRLLRHRRVITIAVVVLLAGTVTTIAVAKHLDAVTRHRYLDAAQLDAGGFSAWAAPDVGTGSGNRLATEVRRHHDQRFLIEIHNPSSVPQTLLGLAAGGEASQPPDRLEISTESAADGPSLPRLKINRLHYVRVSVTLPPGADRILRYTTHVNTCWLRGRADIWTDLEVRVRSGPFTRIENIRLSPHLVLVARHANCFKTY